MYPISGWHSLFGPMCKWLASIWNEIMSFSGRDFWNTEEFNVRILWVFLNKENWLHYCYFSHVKYFQMLEILILPPLLFRTDFPGYRGILYVHNFLVFWVISNLFRCQKSQFSCPGLPVNYHANFTYSFPKLKIILIPTMTRSNCFSFITLIACTGPPMPETLLLCGIDLLNCPK